MSVYSPLQQRLANAAQESVTMSFGEIERILGRKLPPSAYDEQIKRQWWANTDTHSQARAWLRVGRKARLDAARNHVTFVRETPAVWEDAPSLPLDSLTAAARRLVEEVSQERGLAPAAAAAALLDDAARLRRRKVLDAMDEIRGRSIYSDVSSVDLIREDRDGR